MFGMTSCSVQERISIQRLIIAFVLPFFFFLANYILSRNSQELIQLGFLKCGRNVEYDLLYCVRKIWPLPACFSLCLSVLPHFPFKFLSIFLRKHCN